MIEKKFGEYIRDLRAYGNMTLRQASIATKIPVTRLSEIETHRALDLKAHEVQTIGRSYPRIKDNLKHFEKLVSEYEPNFELIQRQQEIHEALRSGASSGEMAARFGVLICKASHEDVEDFRDLCEESYHKPN